MAEVAGPGRPATGRGEKGDASPDSELRLARLVRTIEGEIVPRLVLARRVGAGAGRRQGAAAQGAGRR